MGTTVPLVGIRGLAGTCRDVTQEFLAEIDERAAARPLDNSAIALIAAAKELGSIVRCEAPRGLSIRDYKSCTEPPQRILILNLHPLFTGTQNVGPIAPL